MTDLDRFEDDHGALWEPRDAIELPEHPAIEHAAKMLAALGITGDEKTPARLVAALDEMTAARIVDPRRHLGVRFPGESERPCLVVVTDIPFVSVCEHHMLPFTGYATVAYLPNAGDDIVGLSKLARVVQEYAARPQVQERLTDQVVSAFMGELDAAGAACAIRGVHTCMSLRGARTGGHSSMITRRYTGALIGDPWRVEFNDALTTAPWR